MVIKTNNRQIDILEYSTQLNFHLYSTHYFSVRSQWRISCIRSGQCSAGDISKTFFHIEKYYERCSTYTMMGLLEERCGISGEEGGAGWTKKVSIILNAKFGG